MNYRLIHSNNIVVVSSTSYESPLQELEAIARDIQLRHYSGEVVFDLLCVNGTSSNRFLSMFFDGLNFQRHTARPMPQPDAKLISRQDSFYKRHKEFIVQSVLSSELQAHFT